MPAHPFLAAVLLVAVTACNKTQLFRGAGGAPGTSGQNVPTTDTSSDGDQNDVPANPSPTGSTTTPPESTDPGNADPGSTNPGRSNDIPPVTEPPEHSEPLALRLIGRTYEAWFRNCLTVENFNASGQLVERKHLGCNKDADLVGRIVPLAHASGCNRIRLTIETHEPTPEAARECRARQHEAGFVCNGPYPAQPTRVRTSQTHPDFFRVYESRNVAAHDPRIVIPGWTPEDWLALQDNARRLHKPGHRWMISFFEDQPTLTGDGVDFNDFIFDIDSKGVEFTVDGSGIACN